MRAHRKHCPAPWLAMWAAGCISISCTGEIGPRVGADARSGTGTTGGTTTGAGGSTTTGGVPPTDPGRVTIHRLNRVEYDNTVRDLFGTTLAPSKDFPVDDRGGGFDNMADVLSVSPVLLSLYKSAATALVDQVLADPTERARLVTCELASQGMSCARAILAGIAPRAWRRPVTNAELDRLMALVGVATSRGDNVEQGLRLALQSMLLSPKFIFRIELDPDPASKTPHALDGYELASRLSYFLWSTMPDDELFGAAKDGGLAQTPTLTREVTRMMGSPKSRALVDNFAGQWLYTRMIDDVAPDPGVFPAFDEALRAAMRSEASMLFEDVVKGAIRADQLLTADYTYANDRLAKHYGLPPVGSTNEVKISLAGNAGRGGFLSQGAILTVTSHPTRTSPVVRGKWVLNQLLCTEIPPPPPGIDVTGIDKDTSGTLRQRLEAHRANPRCAACHALMDPVGFGLENYDAIGAYRTTDGQAPIDSAGTLPNGRAFQGALELERIVAADPSYAECVVKNLYVYALGREPELTAGHMDGPTLASLADGFQKGGFSLPDLALRIATSPTFTSRRGEDP